MKKIPLSQKTKVKKKEKDKFWFFLVYKVIQNFGFSDRVYKILSFHKFSLQYRDKK